MKYYCRLIGQHSGGYTVEFPDIRGAITEGETREESLAMAKDALEGVLLCDLDSKLDIPLPVDRSDEGLFPIEVDPSIAERILKSKIAALQKELDALQSAREKKEPAEMATLQGVV